MLIRIRRNFYINTEEVVSLAFLDGAEGALLHLRNGSAHKLSETAAQGLCQFMEVNESLILEDDTPPPATSLTSQIAQMLRDKWNGITLPQLEAVFPDAGMPSIKQAVADLKAEQVLVSIPTHAQRFPASNGQALYYHSSSNEAQAYARLCRNLTLVHFPVNPTMGLCGFEHPGIKTNSLFDGISCNECAILVPVDEIQLTPSPDPLTAAAALPDE